MEPLEDRLGELLRRIDAREVKLELDPRPRDDWYCDYPTFRANGWTLCVFDDAGEWDYLEWAESPQGDRVEFRAGPDPTQAEKVLMAYSPQSERDWGY